MKFQFHLTEKDFFDFNLFVVKHNKAYDKQISILRIIFALAPIVIAILPFILEKEEAVPGARLVNVAVMLILSVLFYVFFPKLHDALLKFNLKHLMLKSGKMNFLGEHSFTFEEEQLHIETKNAETTLNYSAFTESATSETAIYLLTSGTTGYILPFRIFSDEKEKNEFLSFINQKIHS